MIKKITLFLLFVLSGLAMIANAKFWPILEYFQIIIPLLFVVLAWKSREYALHFLVAEIVLGGAGGSWLVYPYGISIRILLLALFVLIWFYQLADKREYLRSLRQNHFTKWILILGIGFPVIFGLLMHLFYPKNLAFLLDDANGWVFYLMLLPILQIINTRKKLWKLVKVYLSAIAVLAIIISVFYFLSINDFFNIYFLQYWALTKMGMGGKIGIMPDGIHRIFLAGSVFLPTGLFVLGGLIGKKFSWPLTSSNNTIKLLLAIFIIYLALIASYTRGLWIGVILALAFFLFWVPIKKKIKIIIITALFIAFSQVLFSRAFGQPFLDVFLGRLSSTVSVAKDPVSVGARVSQIKVLGGQILRNPIFGTGFGTTIDDYRSEVAAPFSFELGYLDMVVKFGVVGFAIWGLFVLKIIFGFLRKLWFSFSLKSEDKGLLLGVLTGLLAFLFSAGTSPFATSAFGIMQIVLAIVILERIKE